MSASQTRRRLAGVPVALPLAGLTACGSSSPSHPSTSTSTSPTTAPSSANPNAAACAKVGTTLATAQSQLTAAIANPKQGGPAGDAFIAQLRSEAASGSSQLQSAVGTFTSSIAHALALVQAGKRPNLQSLLTSAAAISQLCQSGSGTSPSAGSS